VGSGERRSERVEAHNGVWFKVDVGRTGNADPRWLVPLICKRGGVTNAEIGRIHILAKETRFLLGDEEAGLLGEEVARRFAKAAERPDVKDPWHIEPLFQNEARGAKGGEVSRPQRAERPVDGPAKAGRKFERPEYSSRTERPRATDRGERDGRAAASPRPRSYEKAGFSKPGYSKDGPPKDGRARTAGARKSR